MLDRARRKHARAAFTGRLSDVEDLRQEDDASYDAVVARHLVWTLVNPHAAFAEWRRVLKPGGRLLLIDGDWISTPPLGRLMRAVADVIAPRDDMHHSVDMAEHDRIVSEVHYRKGLTAAQLTQDLQTHGFNDLRTQGIARIYWWGMRRAPLGDRLRLAAALRFAVSARRAGMK
jgi:ubiquinone/menaquinone biosynthesis C-methylase UbiE